MKEKVHSKIAIDNELSTKEAVSKEEAIERLKKAIQRLENTEKETSVFFLLTLFETERL